MEVNRLSAWHSGNTAFDRIVFAAIARAAPEPSNQCLSSYALRRGSER
jgi:hypothetical protein